MPFSIIRNDITKVAADAIVNTANPFPTYDAGTDQAIYLAAGKDELLKEREKIGRINPGNAAYTSAFNLPAKYIIHTVGPLWIDGKHRELDILQSCYENSLALAKELKCESIAFPLISTGVYGFPKDKALHIAMTVIQKFVMENEINVILVVFDKSSFELSEKVVADIDAFIDSNYVEKTSEWEYSDPYSFDTEGYEHNKHILSKGLFFKKLDDRDVIGSDLEKYFAAKEGKNVDVDFLLSTQEKTFQEKLFEYMDEKGLAPAEVYKPVGISKQVFSKLMCDKDYHPTKYTAILFCISLKLNLEQTKDLLGRAGWSLSNSNKMDLIVQACIHNKEYNLVKMDIILFDKCDMTLKEIK